MQLKKAKAKNLKNFRLSNDLMARLSSFGAVNLLNRKSLLFMMLFSILFIGLIVGVFLQRNYGFSNLFAKPIILDGPGIIKRQIFSQFMSPEVLSLDIKYDDRIKIEYIREKALRAGTVLGLKNDWVNIKLRYKNESYKAKIRLKGSNAEEHLRDERWSFRLKLKGKNSILGMNEFAAMDPMRRNLIGGWFIRKVYQKEGLISRKYEFVRIKINGENKGIYVLDERYDKTMLARNKRKEGPVIKLHNAPIFANEVRGKTERDDFYIALDFSTFNKKDILNDDVLREQFLNARDIMEKFRLGELSTSEVFDVDLMAKWFAIGDLLGAWHGFAFPNMRFYYNPITSKFEPVPDDDYNERAYNYAADVRLTRLNDTYNSNQFLNHILSDHKFIERYVAELERISNAAYIDNLFAELGEQIDEISYILAEDYPFYNFLLDSKNNTYKNAESLQNILKVEFGLQAHFKKFIKNESISFDIANAQSIPLEILYLTDGGSEIFSPLLSERYIVDGKPHEKPVAHQNYEFSVPRLNELSNESLRNMEVVYRVVGTKSKRSTKIIPYPPFQLNYEESDFIRKDHNIDSFSFLVIDDKNKEILFKKGDWILSKDMIIPTGYSVIIPAGVTLDLVESAMILSYSPISMIGEENNYVEISSSDKTGQGITVLGASKQSLVKFTNFTFLSRPKKGRWALTGAINFYKSPVSMYQVSFSDNIIGDDYLNIIRAKFLLSDIRIVNAHADALDVDFSSGSINQSVFLNCGIGDKGGDCIDLSGSQVKMNKIVIEKVADKGVSVGEASKVNIDSIKITAAKIAIAGKDESVVDISNLHIQSTEVGVTAFNKKHQYGPSKVTISGVDLQSVEYPYLVDQQSSLTVDLALIDVIDQGLRNRFYSE